MSWKRVLFRAHWLIGIVAGLVLAFVATTGALLSFKDEILARLDTASAVSDDASWPSPDRLLATVREQRPGERVQMLSWSRGPYAVQARLQASPPNKPETLRFSAEGTALIAPQRGQGFFESVEGLHRSLGAGPAGKAIIGDIGSAAFDGVRHELRRVRDANLDFRFVYLMRPDPADAARFVFLADAETPESSDYSAPGDVYDGPSAALAQVWGSGMPLVEEPSRDRWAYWVTHLRKSAKSVDKTLLTYNPSRPFANSPSPKLPEYSRRCPRKSFPWV